MDRRQRGISKNTGAIGREMVKIKLMQIGELFEVACSRACNTRHAGNGRRNAIRITFEYFRKMIMITD